jgi:hypothetical protein
MRCHVLQAEGAVQKRGRGSLGLSLFGALVHPGPNQTYLLGGEGLRHISRTAFLATGLAFAFFPTIGRGAFAIRASARTGVIAGAATRTSASASATLGRHGCFIINSSDSDDQGAFLAFSRNDNFFILAPLENAFESGQFKPGFGPLFSMATNAGGIKKRFDILGVSDSGNLRGGWQFAQVRLLGEGGCGEDC